MLASAPRARTSDPVTSRIAADWITTSGVRAAHQQKILRAIQHHPGSTYVELASLTGLDRHAVGRRLKEIEAEGHIRRGQPVTRGGRPMTPWWPK